MKVIDKTKEQLIKIIIKSLKKKKVLKMWKKKLLNII